MVHTFANPWILTLHLIALLIWLGHMLVLSRLAGHQAVEGNPSVLAFLRRSWLRGSMPALFAVLVTGLLMLHGVGSASLATPGDALYHYFKPKLPDGSVKFWYVTFHVKLVSFTLLLLGDVWLGMRIRGMVKGNAPGKGIAFAVWMAVCWAVLGMVVPTLLLSWLHVPSFRLIGYGFMAVAAAAAFFGARKAVASGGRAPFVAMDATTGALVALVISLVVAKPLAMGWPT